MAVLMDADVFVEAERGRFDLIGWLEDHAEEEVVVAAITVAELWRGVERAAVTDHPIRAKFVERLIETFQVVPYTEGTAREHARLWAEVERTGFMVGAHDILLAATAMERGDTVATFNARRFALIPNLKVIQLS
jgi:tRNA(fMet)-specific endonuclease VapC